MQVGEAVNISLTPDNGERCWACEQEPGPTIVNNLVESPSSLGEPENQLNNDSSELGNNLGFRPNWTIRVPFTDPVTGKIEIVTAVITAAAHHLIPGNASLNKCPSILNLIDASRGKIQSDIGYNVNSAQNGVWLPANYGVNEDSVFGKWSLYSHQMAYALAAMDKAGAQFHDAHPVYSRLVLRSLRSIADKITLKAPEKCGICDKKIADKARPPYGLVGRLNKLSSLHRKFLRGPVRKWPVQTGYFTSRWSAVRKTTPV